MRYDRLFASKLRRKKSGEAIVIPDGYYFFATKGPDELKLLVDEHLGTNVTSFPYLDPVDLHATIESARASDGTYIAPEKQKLIDLVEDLHILLGSIELVSVMMAWGEEEPRELRIIAEEAGRRRVTVLSDLTDFMTDKKFSVQKIASIIEGKF